MLNAILSGKAGRTDLGGGEARSWREIFKANEDLVTATVFERLSYLPGSLMWAILAIAAKKQLPFYRMASLTNFEFWPKWPRSEFPSEEHKYVEPDVFLEFDLGDPVQRAHVIVEAKFGGWQDGKQWDQEVKAWKDFILDQELVPPDVVYFISLSGNWAGLDESWLYSSWSKVQPMPDVHLIRMDWNDIARSCFSYADQELAPEDRRVIRNIKEALAEFGVFHRVEPMQWKDLDRLVDPSGSMTAMKGVTL